MVLICQYSCRRGVLVRKCERCGLRYSAQYECESPQYFVGDRDHYFVLRVFEGSRKLNSMHQVWAAMSRLFTPTACLIFGIVEGLLAGLWCLAGAGIYGSPLGSMSGLELAHVWAFLLIGPFSAFLAGIISPWKPRGAAIWLIGGGLVSGALAVPFIPTDALIMPLVFVSLPMLIMGWMRIRASARESGIERTIGAPATQAPRRGVGTIFVGAFLFLMAFIGTYVLVMAMLINNVTSLRGPPRADNPFVHEGEDWADTVVVSIVAAVVGLITIARKHLRLRGEAVAGMWLALLLSGLILLIR